MRPKPTWRRSSASASRCSRWPPRCSPTRRSPRASPTATSPSAAISGRTPIRHRTGMLPFVFEDGFGYERYCRLCARRADVLRLPRRPIYRRRRPELPRLPRRQAARACRARSRALRDWIDHLSTAFPEVRLKSFLEMRGADGGRWGRICALPAFWVGLLYDQARSMPPGTGQALDASRSARRLRDAVPQLALDAPMPGGGTLRDLARRVARHRRGRPAARADRTPAATMKAASSIRSAKSSPAARTPAERLLDNIMATGAATFAASTRS